MVSLADPVWTSHYAKRALDFTHCRLITPLSSRASGSRRCFSLGRSARDPSGIRSEGTNLLVADRTRVYRGRSRVAGYRGIAVGFPGGVNYAFNAQNGVLTALWQGEFVSVYWGGQGAGNFNPKGRAIELAQDVAFYRLAKDDAPWPLRPMEPTNQRRLQSLYVCLYTWTYSGSQPFYENRKLTNSISTSPPKIKTPTSKNQVR